MYTLVTCKGLNNAHQKRNVIISIQTMSELVHYWPHSPAELCRGNMAWTRRESGNGRVIKEAMEAERVRKEGTEKEHVFKWSSGAE